MFIGYFTERPYQDPQLGLLRRHRRATSPTSSLSNGAYDPKLGAELYNRYLDEKVYAEEMGFDGLMLNEHHSTPFCMGGVDERRGGDPRAHHQARQDRAARQRPADLGRPAVAGRRAGRDRHDLARAGWSPAGCAAPAARASPTTPSRPTTGSASRRRTTSSSRRGPKPGPFRWEGEHYQYRYVNPWARPYQQPAPADLDPRRHVSRNTVAWAAEAPLPVRHARHRARADAAVVRLLRRVREGARLRGRHPAPRLPVQGPRRRDRGAGRAGRRASTSRARATRSSKATRATSAVHPEPARPDLAHAAAADRQHASPPRSRGGSRTACNRGRPTGQDRPTSSAPSSSRSTR